MKVNKYEERKIVFKTGRAQQGLHMKWMTYGEFLLELDAICCMNDSGPLPGNRRPAAQETLGDVRALPCDQEQCR